MIPLIKVKNMRTRLHNVAHIVDDVSFEIKSGETFALLGESGCGKSMTALSMMRLLPDGILLAGGEVNLNNEDVLALPERKMREVRGRQIAMIFQEPGLSLNPVMSVGEQIVEVLELHHSLKDSAADARAIALLQQVGIPDAAQRLHEYPFQLSGGMKQRVMIAMALAGEPTLLIADEPTTALDVTIQAQVLQLLRDTQAQQGMAMLLITHDLGVVAQMAHHVAVMYAGQIIEQAPREKLFSEPQHPYTKKLFAALPDARSKDQVLAAIPGNVPALGAIEKGCRFAPRCDHASELCHEQAPQWVVLSDGQGVRCHLFSAAEERALMSERVVQRVPQHAATAYAAHSPQSPVLEVNDLQVHFPIRKGILQRTVGQVKAVDGLSLGIEAGRTLALVGESGCGKTTVGKALLQLVKPTAGSVRFAGSEMTGLNSTQLRALRGGMQMIFQDPYASLNPKMRVAEILQEGMDALSIGINGKDRQQRIDVLLDQVGLSQSAKWRYPHEFSGGQRQRIAIARALAVNPKLLICDEPTSALDVSVQAQILNLLKALQQELGLSYLFITHNLAVVEYIAHEVCVMYLGRIVERGTVDEVMHHAQHPYTQALMSAIPRIDGNAVELIRLTGEMPSPAKPPKGCYFHPRCAYATALCHSAYPGGSNASETHLVHCHLASGL
jgi:peptide/nickel transport system ATP-binding protein